MKKLKVLQIVGDPSGGIRKHVHDVLFNLNAEFDFYYISSVAGDDTYFKECGLLECRIRNITTLKISKKPSFSDVSNVLKISKYIKQFQIDIVHGHGAKGGVYARLCGKMRGCKVIYTPHGGAVHNMFGRIEGWIYKLVEAKLAKMTDLFVFESHYSKNSFNRKILCRTVNQIVNYNGIDSATLAYEYTDKAKLRSTRKIGYFGMLRQQKGPQIALLGISKLIAKGEDLEFHIYGNGPLMDDLKDKVMSKGLTDRIFIHGEVSNAYQHMAEMDFIIIPSLFESFGYVAVEAMLMGIPLISAKAGGLNEVVNANCSFMFEPDDTASLQNAVLGAISTDQKDLEEMVKQARIHARRKFDIKDKMLSLKKLYREV